jgi:hypothetical protein
LISFAFRCAFGEEPLAGALLPAAQFLHLLRHLVVQRAVDKVLREEHALELPVRLLARKHLPCLLQLALPLPPVLVQEGVRQLDRLAVRDLEPRVDQDLLYPLQRTNPVGRTLRQQPLNQRLHLLADRGGLREFRLGVEDGLEDLLLLRSVEGRSAEEQLVEQDTEGVEVHLVGMTRSE